MKNIDPSPFVHVLENYIFDPWYSRVLDTEHGGFYTKFDYQWRKNGEQFKMLEPQARQTRIAAQGALFNSARTDLKQAAHHGFEYIKDTMWDQDYGGWYRMVSKEGSALESGSKHVHGMAYAIAACVKYYQLSKEDSALELAKSAFNWLETHAHDLENGGYYVYFLRDGTLIRSADQCPLQITDDSIDDPANGFVATTDPLGNPLGFKDANTTCDLLEALADLYSIWPNSIVFERIKELYTIVVNKITLPSGAMHFAFSPDWRPSPHLLLYGHGLQSVGQLLKAAETLDCTNETRTFVTKVVDLSLEVAWDKTKGGFYFAGSVTGPIYIDDREVFIRDKSWWVQAEGLRSLLILSMVNKPSVGSMYADYFVKLWSYIYENIIDFEFGGWKRFGNGEGPVQNATKAGLWKDSFHEARAMMNVIKMLRSNTPVWE